MKKTITILVILSVFFLIIFEINNTSKKNNTNYSNLMTNNFKEDFEDYQAIEEILKDDFNGWHNIQKTLSKNLVEITSEKVHSGNKALKTFAVKYKNQPNASKAAIQRELFNFTKGDDVWVSAWFYLEDSPGAKNLFLFDIEAPETKNILGRKSSPGRRIFLGARDEIISDLGKWHDDAMFRQEYDKEISLPKGRWFNLKIHLFLSEDNDGLMEVWQDDILVLNSNGITLPKADSIYSRIQIGITANGNEEYSQTLYVDDIIISDSQI